MESLNLGPKVKHLGVIERSKFTGGRETVYCGAESRRHFVSASLGHRETPDRKAGPTKGIISKIISQGSFKSMLDAQSSYFKSTTRSQNTVQDQTRKNRKTRVQNDMGQYENRLVTFDLVPSWPKPQISSSQLAHIGLYYVGIEDLTKCFKCHVEIIDWNERSYPLKSHFSASPNCTFLHEEFENQVEQLCKIEFSMYSSFDSRVSSYHRWPIPQLVTAHELASAGWYHVNGTSMQCFTCGVVCKDWKKGDDPLIKHKLLNKNCSFVNQSYTTESFDGTTHRSSYESLPNNKEQNIQSNAEKLASYESQIEDESSLQSKDITLTSDIYNQPISIPPSFNKEPTQSPSFDNYQSTASSLIVDECVVCLTNSKQYAVVPCGHLCMCKDCSDRVTHCPVCRGFKEKILKVYVS